MKTTATKTGFGPQGGEGLFSRSGGSSDTPDDSPLADRMRPRALDDVIGQDHIVGPGRLLRRAIQADRLSSAIFYGPPGTGKTSLARVIANTTKSAFESLNAVLSGVKDIREAIDRSDERRRLYGRRTILFVDEVHRWNKAQQDALLPWVENGTVILIGATTENPFFEVNRALVSRSRIFQLKSLTPDDLMEAARRTLADKERGYGKWKVVFEEGALEHLVEVSGGDARSLLNALELSIETSEWKLPEDNLTIDRTNKRHALETKVPGVSGSPSPSWPPPEGAEITVSMEAAEESIQRRAVLYDRDGDYHFDTISAFIKSVRGSDPDAALYWLAKMVRAGEDPSFIFRRMIILASEDVGMADPRALGVVVSCAEAFDRIGFPEGNFPLAEACLYLASAPKSNSALAFFDALKEVDREDAEVPNHLRDASRDAEGFGHGEGYVYPHAYRDHWAAQQYLPTALRGKTFYNPSSTGYEGKIRDEVLRKREVQAAIVLGEESGLSRAEGEILTWSASGKGREGWFKRLESGRGAVLIADRDALFAAAVPARHYRILVPAADDGLLLWEALRRVPEGLAAALAGSEAARDALIRFAGTFALGGEEAPEIAVWPGTESSLLPPPAWAEENLGSPVFDTILFREPFRRIRGDFRAVFAETAASAARLLAPDGRAVLLASPPILGQRISALLEPENELARRRGGTEGLPEGKLSRRHGGTEEEEGAGGEGKGAAEGIHALAEAERRFFEADDAEGLPENKFSRRHGETEARRRGGEDGVLDGKRYWTWTGDDLVRAFENEGLSVQCEVLEREEERLTGEKDLSRWFDGEKSLWGRAMAAALGEQAFAALGERFLETAKKGPLLWRWKSILLTAMPTARR